MLQKYVYHTQAVQKDHTQAVQELHSKITKSAYVSTIHL